MNSIGLSGNVIETGKGIKTKYMHTRKLFTLGLLATGLLFTACNDDEDDDPDPVLGPRLDMVELGSDAEGGDITISEGDILQFAWDARRGASDMETFDVVVTGVNTPSSLPTSTEGNNFTYNMDNDDEEIYLDTLVFDEAGTAIGSTNYTFTVTDGNGAQSFVSYDVLVVEASATLTTSDFTWTRTGGQPAVGLDQFGLEWTDNLDIAGTVSAIVAQDEATVFVELTEDDWMNLQTVEELQDAILEADINGNSIDQYTGVSAEAGGTYSDYLGVINDDVAYILSIQDAIVVPGGSLGTVITIMGEYKN